MIRSYGPPPGPLTIPPYDPPTALTTSWDAPAPACLGYGELEYTLGNVTHGHRSAVDAPVSVWWLKILLFANATRGGVRRIFGAGTHHRDNMMYSTTVEDKVRARTHKHQQFSFI